MPTITNSNSHTKKLLRILRACKGEVKPEEAVEVLNHLIELGIAEMVLDMQGHFKPETIVDFVRLTEEFGDGIS